jgi:archaetidylinositol phosphate synthase
LEGKNKRDRQREALERFIEGPVEFLIRHNISPNLLSVIGFLCSLLAAFFIAIGATHFPIWFAWPAPFLIFWSGVFDVFDGEVARKTRGESQTGAFLDSNLDRLSDAALILGMIYGKLIDFLLGFTILFLIIMISYTRSRAENEGVNMKGVGLMERAERLVYIMFILSLENWIYYLSRIFTWNLVLLFLAEFFFLTFILIFTGLLCLTLIQRFVFTFKDLRKSEVKEK